MQSFKNMLPIRQKALVGTRDALSALEKNMFVFRHLENGQRISITPKFSRYFVMDVDKIISLPEIKQEIAEAKITEHPLRHAVTYAARYFTLKRKIGEGYHDRTKAALPFSEIMASKRGECFEKTLLAQILGNALGGSLLTALGMMKHFDGHRWITQAHAFNLLDKQKDGIFLIDAAFPIRYGAAFIIHDGIMPPFLCGLPDGLVLTKKLFSDDRYAIGSGFPFQFCMELSVPVDMGPAESKNDVRYYQFSFPRLVLPAGEWGALTLQKKK